MKYSMKKTTALMLAIIMLMSASVISATAETVKWTEEATADGWIKITQEGGKTLGYSKDSGITILTVDGFAFKDMNRNGSLDAYEDWRLDAEERAINLAQLMKGTDQAKLMMFLSQTSPESTVKLGKDMEEEIISGFRAFSTRGRSVKDSVSAVNMLQSFAEKQLFAVPIDLRGDVGNSLTSKWPNHLGFAATFDPDLAAEFSRIYSSELRDLGLTSLHHPQMDLASEPRWRRFSCTFGECPMLSSDMGAAMVYGLQSTFTEDGTDIGWGDDSCIALIKHFPGDGAGEGGRESHARTGKFEVYPGNNFEMHVAVYEKALTNLPGLTKSAAGVMTNYSESVNADGSAVGDDEKPTGTAYSIYKNIGLLRNRYNWDGIICTDWAILTDRPWGQEDLTIPERIKKALEADNDRIEEFNDRTAIMEGFALYEAAYGKEATDERVAESVRRLARVGMQIGLYENPYLSLEESSANVASEDKVAAGYETMLKTVVMLKNTDNLIKPAGEEKPTVYIPYCNYAPSVNWVGIRNTTVGIPVAVEVASEFFNVVTDSISETLTGPADSKGNPTVSLNDIVRAPAEEIAACDFALVFVNSPAYILRDPSAGMFGGLGYDGEMQAYVPLSLQYRPYTADSEYVRKVSIAGDPIEGGMENRSYYGQTAKSANEHQLDLILDTAKLCDKVVVVANASNPFIVSEFESEIDALLLSFNTDVRAICEIVAGKVEPSALLPMQMPANMETVEAQYEDVPFDMECHVDANGNTYDFGFGLNWSGIIKDARNEKYTKESLIIK